MGKWRDKPILFEVYDRRRPDSPARLGSFLKRGGLRGPGDEPQSPPADTSGNGARASTQPWERGLASLRWLLAGAPRLWRGPALVALAAAVLVLAVAAYYVGKRLVDGTPAAPPTDDPIASALREAPDPSVLEVPASQRRGGGRIAVPPRADDAGANPATAENAKESPAAPAAPKPAVRTKGWTYLVIQHFPRTREDDARAAAEFLRKSDIACDVDVLAREVRIVSSEGFLVDQKDAAASQQARQRLEELKRRVLAAGKVYARTGKYAFEMCYPQRF